MTLGELIIGGVLVAIAVLVLLPLIKRFLDWLAERLAPLLTP